MEEASGLPLAGDLQLAGAVMWMIQDDPLQIDRSLFCGHKICVDLAHILYTAQSVQYVYNIYIYIDLWFVCLNGSVSRRYIFRNMRNEIKPRRQEK